MMLWHGLRALVRHRVPQAMTPQSQAVYLQDTQSTERQVDVKGTLSRRHKAVSGRSQKWPINDPTLIHDPAKAARKQQLISST